MPAKLPEERRLSQVKDMSIGEIAYVSQCTFRASTEGECYLRTDHIMRPKISSDYPLRIQRKRNGFIAFIYETDYAWVMSEDMDISQVEGSVYAPVIGFGDALDYNTLSKEELEQALHEAEAAEDYEEAALLRNLIKSEKK